MAEPASQGRLVEEKVVPVIEETAVVYKERVVTDRARVITAQAARLPARAASSPATRPISAYSTSQAARICARVAPSVFSTTASRTGPVAPPNTDRASAALVSASPPTSSI